MYAIVKSAEFYGAHTVIQPIVDDRARVITYATRQAAQAAMAALVNAPIELAHNQASAWAYAVRRVPSGRAMWRGAYV